MLHGIEYQQEPLFQLTMCVTGLMNNDNGSAGRWTFGRNEHNTHSVTAVSVMCPNHALQNRIEVTVRKTRTNCPIKSHWRVGLVSIFTRLNSGVFNSERNVVLMAKNIKHHMHSK